MEALSHFTGFSEGKIKELMKPGKGPKVIVVKNLQNGGRDISGLYDPVNKVLKIDDGYVNGLDIVNSPIRYQAIGLLLTITTLHEFVHYGRDINGMPDRIPSGNGSKYEAGVAFEDSITPGNTGALDSYTAIDWLNYYKINPK